MVSRVISVSPVEELAVAAHRPYALDQRRGLRLQVDDQVRARRLRLERVEYLLVEMQLVAVEGQPGEQRVLLEQEIAHRDAAEQIQLYELAQLGDPLEEKEQLRRQREPCHVLIEPRQERVLLGTLEDQVRLHPGGEAPGEAGLADAYRPFDDDVAVLEGHRGSRNRRPSYTREARIRRGR